MVADMHTKLSPAKLVKMDPPVLDVSETNRFRGDALRSIC